MKKHAKKIISLFLCAIIMLGSVAIGGEGFIELIDAFTVKAHAATQLDVTADDALKWVQDNYRNVAGAYEEGDYYGECLSLVKRYIYYGLKLGGKNAFSVPNNCACKMDECEFIQDNFEKKTSGNAMPGDIFVWDPGVNGAVSPFGHVGIITSVNGSSYAYVDWDRYTFTARTGSASSYSYLIRPCFKPKYSINTELCTVSTNRADSGTRVYLKPATKYGWAFAGVEGVSCQMVDGYYSFVMPNHDVTVKAVYRKVSQDMTRNLEGKIIKIKSFDNGKYFIGGSNTGSSDKLNVRAISIQSVASKYKVLVHGDGWASLYNTVAKKFLTVQGNNGSEYLGCFANDCQSWECFRIYKYGDDFFLLSQRTGRLMQLNERSGGNNTIIPTDRYYDINNLDGADWERFRLYEDNNEMFQSWDYKKFDSNSLISSAVRVVRSVLRLQDKYVIPNTVPLRDGYSFVGWSTKANSNTAEYQPGDTVENGSSLVLHEVWNKIRTDMSLSSYVCELDITNKKTETIHVHANGDFPAKGFSVYVTSGNNSIVAANASNSVLKKEVWHETLDSDITITAKNPGKTKLTVSVGDPALPESVTSTIDVDVSATYTITYNVDGAIQTQSKKFREDIVLLDIIPEKANHFFLGWSTVQGATKPTYGPGDVFAENRNVTMYPVWSKQEYVKIKSFSNGTLVIEGNGIMASYPTGKTPWKDYASSCTKIVIESGVTTIGANAFAGFVNLKTVILPDDLTSIGSKAFYNCSNLVSINAPSALIKIGSSAFEGCKKLKSLPIPKGSPAVAIGAFAFKACLDLIDLVIPNSVISLGIGSFEGCFGLKSVEIPSSIQEIPETAFFGCKSLESVELPEGVQIIDDGAFSGCSAIEEIEIPDSVTEIGEQAFSGCSVLSDVIIPENVKYVGVSAFSNCSMLESVDIPEGIQSIGSGAFSGCSVLDNVKLPDSITFIPDGLFTNCSSLSKIEYSEEIAAIGNSAFLGCSSLSSLSWPETLTEIDDYAFYDCSSLECVDLNEGLKRIGICAFGNCEAIPYIGIPASVDSIGDLAFMNCTSLSTVYLQESEIFIGDYAFSGCTSITEVTLPDGAEVGEDIFSDCSSSLTVNCYSTSAALQPIADSGITTNTIYRAESVIMDRKQVTVEGGKTLQLSALVFPQNATNKTLYWLSSDESIATVDENGLVTGVSSGEATVKAVADDGLIYDDCKVIVNVPVTGLTVSNDSIESFIGNNFILGYDLMPENPTNTAVKWSSSNPDIVSVDNDGIIELHKEGTASITVESLDGHFSDTCLVTSKEYVPISGLTLDKTSQELYVGDSFDLGVEVNPDNSTDSFYNWSFEPEEGENIVSVDEDNTVTAMKSGSVTIYAVSGDIKSNGCIITVLPKVYTVTWNIDGTTTTNEYEPGDSIQKPVNPVKDGFEFKGWTPDIPESMPAEDITFTAVFESVQPDVFTLTYDANGGNNPPVSQTGNGNVNISSIVPTREGYNFLGWSESSEDTTAQYLSGQTYNLTKNTVLHAVWKKTEIPVEPETYTVTFVADGVVVKTVEYTVGDTSVAEPAVPVKDGYTGEWSEYTLAASDITVNAIYTKIDTPTPADEYKLPTSFKEQIAAYNTIVTVSVTLKNVPSDAKVYIDEKEASVNGNTYFAEIGQVSSTKKVKIEVRQGSNVLDSSTLTVKVDTGFFSKLISFFTNFLFNLFKWKKITVNF